MATNEHHKWFKKRDWPAVRNVMLHPDERNGNLDLLVRKYNERDEHGRLPHHWMAAKAQTHTHTLASVGVQSICLNLQALIARDNNGETPIDIARRSGACAEIIGLLSLTPEEARSLGAQGMNRLYALVAYWWEEMFLWISDHDRGQTVTSGSMSTMTSWCVKCSNTTILNFFYMLLAIARNTPSPSCFLLFE